MTNNFSYSIPLMYLFMGPLEYYFRQSFNPTNECMVGKWHAEHDGKLQPKPRF